METTIEFTASVSSVKTMTDNGIRITLDLPETAIKQAAMIMECKRAAIALDVRMIPNESK